MDPVGTTPRDPLQLQLHTNQPTRTQRKAMQMATTEYLNLMPFTVVRAEAVSDGHKMTSVMRNLYATEISEAIDSDALTVSQGRHRGDGGALELVWITNGSDVTGLVAVLAEIARAYSTIGIMVYSDQGSIFVEPLDEQVPPWLDALASSVSA